jgi:hypothetical protein
MRLTATWAIAAGLATLFVFLSSAQSGGSQKGKAVMMTRLYTGSDGQTHAEGTEAKFSPLAVARRRFLQLGYILIHRLGR